MTDEDEDTDSTAVTAILPNRQRPEQRPRYIGPYCPLCVQTYNAMIAPVVFDARRFALSVCDEHMEKLKYAPDDVYELLVDQQFRAVWRWMHPEVHWGEP